MALAHGVLRRLIVARIANLGLVDETGQPIQVQTNLPPGIERRCVYAQPARWVMSETTVAERALVATQIITVEVRIRVEEPGGDIDDAERIAEEIQSAIASGVTTHPEAIGLDQRGRIETSSGDADPTVVAPDPESRVIVNLGLVFTITLVGQVA